MNGETYDSDLQMHKSASQIDMKHLRFMRELAVRGELEHPIAGPSSGEYAVVKTEQE